MKDATCARERDEMRYPKKYIEETVRAAQKERQRLNKTKKEGVICERQKR